jgi:hypothetical protein
MTTQDKLKQLWSEIDSKIVESIKQLNLSYQEGNLTKKKYESEKELIYAYYRGVKDFYDLSVKTLVN